MLLALLRYLGGYLHIRIIGYSPERFLNLCSHHHIFIWKLSPRSNSYEMNISVSNFRKLKPILKKTNTKIIILERYGPGFFFHKHRKRPMFFIGIFLCLGIIFTLSRFVWDIEIKGNYIRTDEALITYLETKEIHHGMPKSKISCDKIVKEIRKEYNDIIWVSASISGARLIIEIKENSDSFTASIQDQSNPTNIVAQRDGIITTIITRSGIPQVHVGDVVIKDQVLVSGQIPVVNDSGEITGYHYTNADADIYAETKLTYDNQTSATYFARDYSGIHKILYYFDVGDYRFSLGSLKHNYKEYTKITEHKQLQLRDNFKLPIHIGFTTIKHYTSKKVTRTKKQVKDILNVSLAKYYEDLIKNETEIIQHDIKIYIEKDFASARGTLSLKEPIGVNAPLIITPRPIEEP